MTPEEADKIAKRLAIPAGIICGMVLGIVGLVLFFGIVGAVALLADLIHYLITR